MDLSEGDYLVGMQVVEKDGLLLSISELGFGKRTPLESTVSRAAAARASST